MASEKGNRTQLEQGDAPPPYTAEENHDTTVSDDGGTETETSGDDETIASRKDRCRVQDIIFAFGPNGSFFISTSLQSYLYQGSKRNSSALDCEKIGRPIAIALTPDNGFLFIFDDENNDGHPSVQLAKPWMTINISVDGIEIDHRALFKQQCQALYDFLRSDKDDSVRRHSTFCMGPLSSQGASWFARLGDGRVKYHDLPKALNLEMQLKDQEPMQVTLGRNGSYVAIWPDDESLTWDLRGYPGLHEMLDETKPGDVNTVVLNPYNDSDWFLVKEDGYVFWRVSNDTVVIRKITRMARGYMQRQAKRRNKTYYCCGTDGGFVISPETNYGQEDRQGDESAWTRLLERLGIRNGSADHPAIDFSHLAPFRALRLPTALSERKHQIATGLGLGVVAVGAAAWASPAVRHAVLARLRVRICPHYYTTIASTAMFFCTCYALGILNFLWIRLLPTRYPSNLLLVAQSSEPPGYPAFTAQRVDPLVMFAFAVAHFASLTVASMLIFPRWMDSLIPAVRQKEGDRSYAPQVVLGAEDIRVTVGLEEGRQGESSDKGEKKNDEGLMAATRVDSDTGKIRSQPNDAESALYDHN